MNSPEALLLEGVAAAERGEAAEAARHWQALIALAPPPALLTQAWFNLGLLLLRMGLRDDAEPCLQAALASDPANHEAEFQLRQLRAERELDAAVTAVEAGRLDAAEHALQRAIADAPQQAVLHRNLGVVLYEQGRHEAAEAALRHAMALAPEDKAAEHALALLLLAAGRHAEGWRHYEARFDPAFSNAQTITPSLPFPRWQGEPLLGKSLLVWPEQGLGDEIQFCRYIPALKAAGARHVSLVCRPALLPLLQTLAGVDQLISSTDAVQAVPAHDYWTFSLSMPLHAGLADIPAALPYLAADPGRRATWGQRLPPRPGPRVGLLWQGNPAHQNDAYRSLHDPALLEILCQVPGVHWIGLQREAGLPAPAAIWPAGAAIHDFADAAAVMAELDLLISVDSAYAHLAGALGVPVWVLLPARQVDWRWLHGRSDSPWYPGVMRLFRQQPASGWGGILTQVRDALIGWPGLGKPRVHDVE